MDTERAERRSRKLDGRSGKRIDADHYMPHRHLAAKRADALVRRHERDGTRFPDNNPSSTMHAFLAAIEPRSAERNSACAGPLTDVD